MTKLTADIIFRAGEGLPLTPEEEEAVRAYEARPQIRRLKAAIRDFDLERRRRLLPDRARVEVRRILDSAARRLLADKLDGDAIGTLTADGNGRSVDGRADQGAALGEREQVPVHGSGDDDTGTVET